MTRQPAVAAGLAALLWAAAPAGGPLVAGEGQVPRTRTFSGLVSPPFPYTRPGEAGISAARLEWIGNEMVRLVESGELVGAELLVLKDQKAVFHETYGWGDREARRPMRRDSIFSIKSMSKPFTATAVLMLTEEGKLSLEDPVHRYVPQVPGQEVKIRHLLSHTSGYGEEHPAGRDEFDLESLGEWVEDWAAEGPDGELGRYAYSDFNYAALGRIVEVAGGTPIGEFTERRIVRPLELEDTSTNLSSVPAWRSRLNPWYRWNPRAGQYDLRWAADRPAWPFYHAAWGMFSTAMDYGKFMVMWMRGGRWNGVRLLPEAAVAEALRPHARVEGRAVYGYGWSLDVSESGRLLGFYHGGGDGTLAMAFPDDGVLVIYLTHSRWGSHRLALWNRLGMSGILSHPGPTLSGGSMLPPGEAGIEAEPLPPGRGARLAGDYAAAKPGRGAPAFLSVREEDGVLKARVGGSRDGPGSLFHLVPLGGDTFALGRFQDGALRGVDPAHRIGFVAEDGTARTLNLTRNGRLLSSARELPSSPPGP